MKLNRLTGVLAVSALAVLALVPLGLTGGVASAASAAKPGTTFHAASLPSGCTLHSQQMPFGSSNYVYTGYGNGPDDNFCNSSPNEAYYIEFQNDGNLCERYTSNNDVIWCSNTGGHSAATLWFQLDGNIVIYPTASPSGALFSTDSTDCGGSIINLQNDKNWVLYTPDNYVCYANAA